MQEYYDTLVLSSGGILGIGHIGVLLYLKDKNVLDKIKHYSGTSAGALVCYLHLLGYEPSEMLSMVYEFNIFPKNSSELTTELLTNITKLGAVLDNNKLLSHLKTITLNKLKYTPTFKNLFDINGKEFVVVATNEKECTTTYFSYKTTPDVHVYEAIAASCNIPLIFNAITINNKDYCDGVCMDPFPIKYMDHSNRKILGIWLSSPPLTPSKTDIVSNIFKYISLMTKGLFISQTQNLTDGCVIKELHIDGKMDNLIKTPDIKNSIHIFNNGYHLLTSPYYEKTALIPQSIDPWIDSVF